jgi:hypothetical protein
MELKLLVQSFLIIRESPTVSLYFKAMKNLLSHLKLGLDIRNLPLSPFLQALNESLQLHE